MLKDQLTSKSISTMAGLTALAVCGLLIYQLMGAKVNNRQRKNQDGADKQCPILLLPANIDALA